jgi:3-methyl-2-oxobutanoate hydroxymethyltransferase
MKETGAHAIKMEGGAVLVETIRKMTQAGIPVMGHLGLTPQSIHQMGSYSVQAKEEKEGNLLIENALLLEQAGCFGIVLEKIPAKLTERTSQLLKIPTIGIGAGNGCDGQVLVVHDMLGLTSDFKPKFVRQYANLGEEIRNAVIGYIDDVKTSNFPNENESYGI